MFTGIVEDVGSVVRTGREGGGLALTLSPGRLDASSLAVGESVAIDGVCLTVEARDEEAFRVLAGQETLERTTLGAVEAGSRVNLERALRAGDRFGGHIVQGHVDGIAEIGARRDRGANLELSFSAPAELLRYVVEKGSVALDGISLTVNEVSGTSFGVALIPHTVAETSLGHKKVGDKVNLEVDMIAKYVEKLVVGYKES